VDAKFNPMIELYKKVSPDGPEHFSIVRQKIECMWAEEPTLSAEELDSIRCPTLVIGATRTTSGWSTHLRCSGQFPMRSSASSRARRT
jgi:hypothetical protein